MGTYEVMSERVLEHRALVRANDEDDAADTYLDGEYVEDLGEKINEETVLSIQEVT